MANHRDDVLLNIDGLIPVDPARGLRQRMRTFLASREWTTDRPEYGDQPEEEDADTGAPRWSMSFNLGLDHVASCAFGWPADVGALIEFVRPISREFDAEFVVEVLYRSKPWYSEHIVFLDGAPVDLGQVRVKIERAVRHPPPAAAPAASERRRPWWKFW